MNENKKYKMLTLVNIWIVEGGGGGWIESAGGNYPVKLPRLKPPTVSGRAHSRVWGW